MSAPKPNTKFGFMAKTESTYGTAVALAGATDGVQLAARPEPSLEYLHDGSRGRAPGSGGKMQSVVPSGLGFAMTAEMEPVGAGAAYSAGVVPPGVHTLLRSGGMEAVGSFTGGAEKYTYTPESGPTGFDSLTVEAYVAGQKHPGRGVYSTFAIAAEGLVVPTWSFELQGIGTIPTDAALPSITYPVVTNLPPKATSIALTIGTFNIPKVRSFTFTVGRELHVRADQSGTDAHAGFTPGDRAPTLEVTIEAVTLHTASPWHTATTLNPYELKDDKIVVAVTIAVGTVQYKRWKLNLPQATLLEVEDGEDGATATWTLTFQPHVSTPILDDDFNIVFD